jgi:hypothetical protein
MYGPHCTHDSIILVYEKNITPCSLLKVSRCFGETHLHHIQVKAGGKLLPPAFSLVSCSAYFLDPEDGDDIFSETSVVFQQTTRRYIPEDSTLHNHRCENLKSYIIHLCIHVVCDYGVLIQSLNLWTLSIVLFLDYFPYFEKI